MKIRSIALLVTSALSLIACKGNSSLDNQSPIDPNTAASLKAETKINFDLLSKNKKLILPTYLAMDPQDGTLATETMAQDKTNTSDPLVAMGQTDGWSTTQPITISFTGKNLDPATAANGFYLIKSGDPTNPDDTTQPTRLTQQAGDFVVKASGDSLIVILLKPLDPASNYMFAVTDDLKDVNGQAVGMSNSYALLKSDNLPPAPALLPAQKITHATEEAFHGIVEKRDIIFSSWFTTLSSGDVLFAAKMATEEAISSGAKNVWQGSAIASNVTSSQLDQLFTLTQPTLLGSTLLKTGNIYTGKITLPYYLDINPDKFMNTPWQSGMPSLAKIKYVLSNGSDADKAALLTQLADAKVSPQEMAAVATDPKTQIDVLTKLMGKKLFLANGEQLDPQRIITRYSAVPELKSVQTIDYTLVMPQDPKCQKLGANSVTIFQHGVTTDKESLIKSTLADTLIKGQCRAIFAINHPLHGDRGIKDKDGLTIAVASGAHGDPSIYLNLTNLTVARDNLRQSTIDVVNLRASIGKLFNIIKQKQLDNSQASSPLDMLNPNADVSFAGHSLGAITGVNVANIANRPTLNPEFDKQYFAINKLALANPGAEIPYLLLNSGSFGGLIKAGILKSTITAPTEVTPEVIATGKFLQTIGQCAQTENLTINQCYKNNISSQSPNLIKQWTEKYVKFAYAAQTVMDPVDPINLASGVTNNINILLEEVIGDSTIPNITSPSVLPYSPFTGTTPLAYQLHLSENNTLKNWQQFTPGDHSSLLDPTISQATTTKMQSDMADFLNR
ncbi:VolA/Pla-1 family phospholipase [Photobacterium kishitanii]|uniref:VolA/Pla-1 family phospholipase n=1 Tax=Photobacterium kishitanii TaxID=318456 RepID=UPI0007F8D5F9|nr:VolA/Pla-1 family phospholipase [Photobacterium kishitanii]OBU28114.1 lipase [Photobacterium kishitanii]PSW51713.1 lipase [Photobacterium kishitanii]